MAATIQISCPSCKKQLSLPETLRGKKIRCKDCGNVFPVDGAGAAKPAAAKPAGKAAAKNDEEDSSAYGLMADDAPPQGQAPATPPPPPPPPKPVAPAVKGKKGVEEENSNPYAVTETEIVARCPHCAKEMESEDAIICLHCGYNTRTRKKAEIKRVLDITPQDKFWWLFPGVVNIFLVLFIIWLAWFFCFSDTMKKTWDYLDENTTEHLSKGIRWWFCFGATYVVYKCGRFAFTRLVLQPVPPEQEIK